MLGGLSDLILSDLTRIKERLGRVAAHSKVPSVSFLTNARSRWGTMSEAKSHDSRLMVRYPDELP
jgi:hypothetical protein